MISREHLHPISTPVMILEIITMYSGTCKPPLKMLKIIVKINAPSNGPAGILSFKKRYPPRTDIKIVKIIRKG